MITALGIRLLGFFTNYRHFALPIIVVLEVICFHLIFRCAAALTGKCNYLTTNILLLCSILKRQRRENIPAYTTEILQTNFFCNLSNNVISLYQK